MQFLSDLFLRCPECEGKRFQPHVLKIVYKGKSIHDVLELTVRDAIEFFAGHARIVHPLQLLADVGLDYLRLGQPVNALSGGESQRLKLASHLAEKRETGALLIFDETDDRPAFRRRGATAPRLPAPCRPGRQRDRDRA